MTLAQLNPADGLPSSPHTEVAILGAMLLDPVAVADAVAKLEASDFSLDSHQRVFRAMLSLQADEIPVDYLTVRERLTSRRELDAIGGPSYLAYLSEGIPRNFNIESYVRIVKEKSLLRQLMGIFHESGVQASDPSEDGRTLIDQTIERLRELTDSDPSNDIPQIGAYLESQGEPEQIFERLATPNGVRFGFNQWDELTGGAQPGELHILAARPSMGKTAWMCNVANYTAVRSGKRVALFSMEQPRDQIVRRMLASAARINAREIKEGTLRSQDRQLLMERRNLLCQSQLFVDDTPGLTLSKIRAKSRRLKERGGLDLIIVDQLNHVDWADFWVRGMQDHAAYGHVAKTCKRIGQELETPFVLLCQLSRESTKRIDPTPRLADLAESGRIEQHADVITFLHRPEYYDRSDESLRGKGQQIVAKNREGATGTLECTYEAAILRWEDEPSPIAHQGNFYE